MLDDMDKFKGKYRNSSARLRYYDYGWDGAYFITICSKDRVHFFGEVVDGEMQLSKMGRIVKCEWLKTSEIRNNVVLGKFVVMPNHFHAVVLIDNDITERCVRQDCPVGTHCNAPLTNVGISPHVSIPRHFQMFPHVSLYKNKFGPQRNNLASIIRGFKGSVTKQIRKMGCEEFAWQAGFYDRIIRDQPELERISEYIVMNPQNWKEDRSF